MQLKKGCRDPVFLNSASEMQHSDDSNTSTGVWSTVPPSLSIHRGSDA